MEKVSLIKAGFAFGDMVAILIELFQIDPAKKDTFVGRLQQLQKAGIPAGANLGRGVKVRYTVAQLITLVTCLDLLDCGATPATLAAYFGDEAGGNLETLFSEGGGNFGAPLKKAEAAGLDLYFLFQASSISYLQAVSDGEREGDKSALLIDGPDKVLSRIDEKPSIVLNMTRRVQAIRSVVERIMPDNVPEFNFGARPTKGH